MWIPPTAFVSVGSDSLAQAGEELSNILDHLRLLPHLLAHQYLSTQNIILVENYLHVSTCNYKLTVTSTIHQKGVKNARPKQRRQRTSFPSSPWHQINRPSCYDMKGSRSQFQCHVVPLVPDEAQREQGQPTETRGLVTGPLAIKRGKQDTTSFSGCPINTSIYGVCSNAMFYDRRVPCQVFDPKGSSLVPAFSFRPRLWLLVLPWPMLFKGWKIWDVATRLWWWSLSYCRYQLWICMYVYI